MQADDLLLQRLHECEDGGGGNALGVGGTTWKNVCHGRTVSPRLRMVQDCRSLVARGQMRMIQRGGEGVFQTLVASGVRREAGGQVREFRGNVIREA